MKRLLPASAALTLAAGSLAAAPAPPDGKALYDANCSACHMVAGEGVPGQQPPLRLSRFAAGPPEAVIRLLLEGSASRTDKRESWPNEMPTFEDLPDDEIAATLTYVRASFGNKAGPITPAQVKAAREKKK